MTIETFQGFLRMGLAIVITAVVLCFLIILFVGTWKAIKNTKERK